MTEAQLAAHLSDPWNRLNGLYLIKAEGKGKPIVPKWRDEQKAVLNHLIHKPAVPLYIIKSRRIGMSTAIGVGASDFTLWTSGVTANLIDQTKPDAHKKSREIVQLAIKSLKTTSPEIWSSISWRNDKVSHLCFAWAGQDDFSYRNFYAGENARGGDSSFLWVSEGGPIAASENQAQWERIQFGAIPSARGGRQVHETTWMGGKTGGMWELIKPVYEGDPTADGVIMFFPWHADPTCVDKRDIPLDSVEDYFKDLEGKIGKKFNKEQKTWYAVQAPKLQDRGNKSMKQEFPSTLEEALETPGANPRFDAAGLDWIEVQQRTGPKPLFCQLVAEGDEYPQIVPCDEASAWLRIWEKPMPGRRYILPSDFCTAVPVTNDGRFDYHATGVLGAPYSKPGTGDVIPTEQVAAILIKQRTPLDLLARRIALLSRLYGDCPVAPEVNNLHGYVHQLRQAGVINIWKRRINIDNPAKGGSAKTVLEPGWNTTVSTKPVAVESLATAIRENAFITYCPYALSELRVFQQTNEALSGHNDDFVLMYAIGSHLISAATAYVPSRPPPAAMPGHEGEQRYDHEGGYGFGSQDIGG